MAKDNGISLLRKIYELDLIIKSLNNQNPFLKENSYYDKYGCKTESDKLLFEIEVAKQGIYNSDQELQDPEEDINLLVSISNIIKNNNELELDEIKRLKRLIILIELNCGIPVRLYSGVEGVCQDLRERAKEVSNGRKRKSEMR